MSLCTLPRRKKYTCHCAPFPEEKNKVRIGPSNPNSPILKSYF